MAIGVHQGVANESNSLHNHALIKSLVLKELQKSRSHWQQFMDEGGFSKATDVHHHLPVIPENRPPANVSQGNPPSTMIEGSSQVQPMVMLHETSEPSTRK